MRHGDAMITVQQWRGIVRGTPGLASQPVSPISELQDNETDIQEAEILTHSSVLVSKTKRSVPSVASVRRDDAVAMTLCPTYGHVVEAVS